MDELEHRRRPLLPPSPGDARVVGAADATATHSKKIPIEYFAPIYLECVLRLLDLQQINLKSFVLAKDRLIGNERKGYVENKFVIFLKFKNEINFFLGKFALLTKNRNFCTEIQNTDTFLIIIFIKTNNGTER